MITTTVCLPLAACGTASFPTTNNISKLGDDALTKKQQDAAIKELQDAAEKQKSVTAPAPIKP